MKKIILLCSSTLLLSACDWEKIEFAQPTVVIQTEIDDDFLDCRLQNLNRYDANTLTDKQISKIISTYHRDNTNCYLDVQAIKRLQEEAKKRAKALDQKKE